MIVWTLLLLVVLVAVTLGFIKALDKLREA